MGAQENRLTLQHSWPRGHPGSQKVAQSMLTTGGFETRSTGLVVSVLAALAAMVASLLLTPGIAHASAPAPPVIHSPAADITISYDTVIISGSAEHGTQVELFENGTVFETVAVDSGASWSVSVSKFADGSYTYTARATNSAGITSAATEPVTVTWDRAAPMVTDAKPTQTGASPNTNLTATFSERMNPATITKATFKLFKVNSDGTTTRVTSTKVTSSSDGLSATLDPFRDSSTLLEVSTKYKAVVTTGAEDLAGNALDQKPTKNGNQRKVWYFTTGTS